MDRLAELIERPWPRVGVIVVGSILSAYLLSFVLKRTFGALAAKTANSFDDEVVDALERPLFLSALCIGLYAASEAAPLVDTVRHIIPKMLQTVLVLSWSRAAFRIVGAVLSGLSRRARQGDMVQPRTLPLFNMMGKLLILGATIYFTFLVWDVDLTAWLASAGIVGIAVGFAAKDSLANFIAGVFILADAPYKIGDFVVLDDGMRGMVTSIGIRSTRILTRDDVEITVPNALMGNSKIINEAGGLDTRHRIRVTVDAAYGSDIDKVHDILNSCPADVEFICADPQPVVIFREFGASGLTHDLYVWIEQSRYRERVQHQLNTRIYKMFAEEGIEIPYSKHDVYIKEMPTPGKAGGVKRVA